VPDGLSLRVSPRLSLERLLSRACVGIESFANVPPSRLSRVGRFRFHRAAGTRESTPHAELERCLDTPAARRSNRQSLQRENSQDLRPRRLRPNLGASGPAHRPQSSRRRFLLAMTTGSSGVLETVGVIPSAVPTSAPASVRISAPNSLCHFSARPRGIQRKVSLPSGTQVVENAARARHHMCPEIIRYPPPEPRRSKFRFFSKRGGKPRLVNNSIVTRTVE
jgi:hypothetical protein